MRDPYEILGVARGAGFEAIRGAYRRACKLRHPGVPGGSPEAMLELNTAYGFILHELKNAGGASGPFVRDIDDELEDMRRAADAGRDASGDARSRAGGTSPGAEPDTLAGLLRGFARGGLKTVSVVFAALVAFGGVLVEANFVSALILLGSGLGFAFSHALKSDKGGILSGGLLLFGLMTIWLPSVRAALIHYPLATISVLILLALILKFAQAGGMAGLLTGGVLALYLIGVVVDDTTRKPAEVAVEPNLAGTQSPNPSATPPERPTPQVTSAPAPPQPKPTPPEPRILRAAQGAMLKFVAGEPYRLFVRTGMATSIRATQGKVAFESSDGECVDALDFAPRTGAGPWLEIDGRLRACGADAVMTVIDLR